MQIAAMDIQQRLENGKKPPVYPKTPFPAAHHDASDTSGVKEVQKQDPAKNYDTTPREEQDANME